MKKLVCILAVVLLSVSAMAQVSTASGSLKTIKSFRLGTCKIVEVTKNDLFKAGIFQRQAKELLEVDVGEVVEAFGVQRINLVLSCRHDRDLVSQRLRPECKKGFYTSDSSAIRIQSSIRSFIS